MTRPKKKRRICCMPENQVFYPNNLKDKGLVILTVDEYEVLRLIDYKQLNQEEAAVIMNVARTTVQSMYSKARKKLATMLVESKKLEIRGGNYILSFGKKELKKRKNSIKSISQKEVIRKFVNKMNIIIPVEESNEKSLISNHLGRTNYYIIYNIGNNTFKFLENPFKDNLSGAGIELAQILVDIDSRVLLTFKCGEKFRKILDAAGFKIYKIESKDLFENIQKYKENKLSLLKNSGNNI